MVAVCKVLCYLLYWIVYVTRLYWLLALPRVDRVMILNTDSVMKSMETAVAYFKIIFLYISRETDGRLKSLYTVCGPALKHRPFKYKEILTTTVLLSHVISLNIYVYFACCTIKNG